jgi:hypothetical protein
MGSTGFSWTLPDHPKLPKGKPVAVVVLDGWGEANPDEYNCIHVAQTPVMDLLKNVRTLFFVPVYLLHLGLHSRSLHFCDCKDAYFCVYFI